VLIALPGCGSITGCVCLLPPFFALITMILLPTTNCRKLTTNFQDTHALIWAHKMPIY